ncbi:hypothetical protein K439DRAFT_1619293 [Ramaria rubella]|nr:hypothetical protein K439DRAFT_1619293 [Ramaria rubella]
MNIAVCSLFKEEITRVAFKQTTFSVSENWFGAILRLKDARSGNNPRDHTHCQVYAGSKLASEVSRDAQIVLLFKFWDQPFCSPVTSTGHIFQRDPIIHFRGSKFHSESESTLQWRAYGNEAVGEALAGEVASLYLAQAASEGTDEGAGDADLFG